jgi:hypothetical protein
VPSLDRGEALNVGVIVHCRRHGFLEARTTVDPERLQTLDPDIDLDAIRSHLRAIERVAAGDENAGPLARLDRSERFGWLVSPSDTVIRPSPVHTGLSIDSQATLDRLFAALVAI